MAGAFNFDDAMFMGYHQAADLVWKMGAIAQTPESKPNTWAMCGGLRDAIAGRAPPLQKKCSCKHHRAGSIRNDRAQTCQTPSCRVIYP
jgi:hypothetical protein